MGAGASGSAPTAYGSKAIGGTTSGCIACYCALRLNLPRRTKRRLPHRVRRPLVAPPVLNQTWALDFMADALYDRRRFRALTILDEGLREGLAIDVGRSIPARRLIRVLEELIALHGRPAALRMDNGPELTAQAFVEW